MVMQRARGRERRAAASPPSRHRSAPNAENRRYGIAAIAATNKIRVGGTKAPPRRFRDSANAASCPRVLYATKLAATSLSLSLVPFLSLSSLPLTLYFSSFFSSSLGLFVSLSILLPLKVFQRVGRATGQIVPDMLVKATSRVRFHWNFATRALFARVWW